MVWNGPGVLAWRRPGQPSRSLLVLCSAWFFDRFDRRDHAGSRASSRGRRERSASGRGSVRNQGGASAHSPRPSSRSALFPQAAAFRLRASINGRTATRPEGLPLVVVRSGREDCLSPSSPRPWISRAGHCWRSLGFGLSSSWSALGTREARFGTEQLLFSCARILPRQFPAAWVAGIRVASLTGLGAAARLALAGQHAGRSAGPLRNVHPVRWRWRWASGAAPASSLKVCIPHCGTSARSTGSRDSTSPAAQRTACRPLCLPDWRRGDSAGQPHSFGVPTNCAEHSHPQAANNSTKMFGVCGRCLRAPG